MDGLSAWAWERKIGMVGDRMETPWGEGHCPRWRDGASKGGAPGVECCDGWTGQGCVRSFGGTEAAADGSQVLANGGSSGVSGRVRGQALGVWGARAREEFRVERIGTARKQGVQTGGRF